MRSRTGVTVLRARPTKPRDEALPAASRSVRGRHTDVILLLCVTMLAFVFPGCGADECSNGQPAHCEGNVAMICDDVHENGTFQWIRQDCGVGFCQLPTAQGELPFCSETHDPDPRCAPFSSTNFLELCQDNKVVGCRYGYVDHSVDCTTGATFGPIFTEGASSGTCVSSANNSAFCALEPTPSSDCQLTEASFGRACKGDQLLVCQSGGYLVKREDCPPGTCVSTPFPDCRP